LPQKIIINLIILIYSFVSHGYGLLVIQQMNRYSRRNLEHGEYQCFNSLQLNMSNYCLVNWSWEYLLLQKIWFPLQFWAFLSVCFLFYFALYCYCFTEDLVSPPVFVCVFVRAFSLLCLPLCVYCYCFKEDLVSTSVLCTLLSERCFSYILF
jgi:hypothetical protein